MSWMNDDITFCANADECGNEKCFRNPCNMKDKSGLHSFSYCKDTELCPLNGNETRNNSSKD